MASASWSCTPAPSKRTEQVHLPAQRLLELESSVSQLLADPNQETRKTVNDSPEGLNRRSRSRHLCDGYHRRVLVTAQLARCRQLPR